MTEHYFSKNPTSELRTKEIEIDILDNHLKITTASGLFSKDKIDRGSLLLINSAKIINNTSVLDLGCGYGIVGISISKAYNLEKITFADVNNRAITITKENCKKNQIKNYKLKQSNIYEKITDTYDAILLNPPQTAGKDVCFEMIEKSVQHLNPKGTLQIVARHQKGGKTLSKKMEDTFGNLEILGKSGGFRIYMSTKK